MEKFNPILQVLLGADSILISSHINPDGDSIGTLIGLGLALESLGKDVLLVNSDETPLVYRFLEGTERILRPEQVEVLPDTVVLVDCTDLDRVGKGLAERLKNVPVLVNIDHHLSNSRFGHYNLVDEGAAATAEIVARILGPLGVRLNKAMATALYTGVVMDTGSFQYSNTTSNTFRLAAYLLEQDVDLDQVRDKLFESQPLEMLRLMGEALLTLKVSADGRIAWVEVTREMLIRTKARDEHCDGLINHLRSVAGVEIAILFREIPDGQIKVGLRSKSMADVNQLAAQFGGGGHRRAAGCVLSGKMNRAVERVLHAAEEVLCISRL
jgi:phosphoesterase RecJ-like protein